MNAVELCYIQPLSNLWLPKNTLDNTSFSPYCLTNNRTIISSLLDPNMVEYMGKTFGTAEAIIYLNGTYQMEDIVSKELSVDYFEKQAYMFLIALWIIRDHTISLLRSLFKRSLVDSHADYTYYPYGQRYFDSAGRSLKQTEYTLEDIRVAGEYYHDYLPHLNTASYEATSHTVTFVPTEFDNTSTRLSRFVHLLNHARTIYDIGLKLALFCSRSEE